MISFVCKGVCFKLGAVTVDPGSSGYNPRPLISYLGALGVPYFFEEQGKVYDLYNPYSFKDTLITSNSSTSNRSS